MDVTMIPWFGNAQERLGFNTAYDAVEGFDKYIEGVASVIYQTDNMPKLCFREPEVSEPIARLRM